MSDDGMVHPLSLWDKVKTGVKSFFKGVGHYLPRGILFVGALFGVSALLGATVSPGWDLLHVAKAWESGAGALAGKFLTSLAIGSAITGGIDAYKGVSHAVQENNAQLQAQAALLERQRGLGPSKQQNIGFMEPEVPSIPGKAVDLLAHTVPHLIH